MNLLSKAVWISSHRLPAVLSPFFKTKAHNKVRSSYSKQKDTFTNISLPWHICFKQFALFGKLFKNRQSIFRNSILLQLLVHCISLPAELPFSCSTHKGGSSTHAALFPVPSQEGQMLFSTFFVNEDYKIRYSKYKLNQLH